MALFIYNDNQSIFAQNRRAQVFSKEAAARLFTVERSFQSFSSNYFKEDGQKKEPVEAREGIERAVRNIYISRVNLLASESKIRDVNTAALEAQNARGELLAKGGEAVHSKAIPQTALKVIV